MGVMNWMAVMCPACPMPSPLLFAIKKIGFVFQSFNLIPDLNLFDNVDVPLRYRGFSAAERKRRIEKVLETVGLASRMKHLPSQLVGRPTAACCHCTRTGRVSRAFLLADEPTGNLDSHMAMSVMELISEINRNGTTIIMVTHDPVAGRDGQPQCTHT